MQYKKDLKRWKRRRTKAFNWWHSGLSYAEIGRRLEVTRQRAYQLVWQAYKEAP